MERLQWLRWGAVAALATGLVFPAFAADGDAPAKPPQKGTTDKPTEPVHRVPRPNLTPSLHPDENFHFNFKPSGDNFASPAPPIMTPQPPPQPLNAVPTKDQMDALSRQTWILPKENPTGADAVNKMFGVQESHLLGTQEKSQEQMTMMERYINAFKPASGPAKDLNATANGQDRKDGSSPFDKSSTDRQSDRQTDRQTDNPGADKWNVMLDRGFPTRDSAPTLAPANEFRPDWFSSAQDEKMQLSRSDAFRRSLNLPTDRFVPRQDHVGVFSPGLVQQQPATPAGSPYSPGASALPGIAASGSSPFDPTAAPSPGKAPQLPSLNFQIPTPLTQPRPSSVAKDDPRKNYQPAVLTLPSRPGAIGPF